MQAMTYDLNMHVYLKQITCEYGLFNDVDNGRLYLISSMNKESGAQAAVPNLIDIKLVSTDPDSPTLNRLHRDVLMNIDLKLTLIDVVLNLNVMKNMTSFAEKFEKSLNRIKYQEYEREVDNLHKSSLSSSQQKKSPVVSQAMSLPLLADAKIKSILSTAGSDESSVSVPARRKRFIIDLDKVELKLNARFDGLRVRLCTQKKNYFQIDISRLEAELKNLPAEKNLDLVLNSISVLDLDENNVSYRRILSLKESSQDLIRVQIKMFNPPPTPLTQSSLLAAQYQKEKFYFKNYYNENYFDIEVTADISKVQFVFLYKNLNTLMVCFSELVFSFIGSIILKKFFLINRVCLKYLIRTQIKHQPKSW
jgi:hypothetical protein